MDKLIYLLIAFTVFVFFILVFQVALESGQSISQRLIQIKNIEPEDDDEMKKPFSERVMLPMYQAIFNLTEKLTPKKIAENYQQTIAQAGLADSYTPVRLIVIQLLLGFFSTFALFLIVQLLNININLLFIILLGLLLFLYPFTRMKSKAQTRRNKIRKALPDMLDMLYISVEAGLSFDSAMKKTAAKMKGPLSEEITRAMDDITKGRDREEALRNIGNRSQVEEVSSFITSVIQSEQLGANIANMLRIQSTVMREKRRQRAEEEAAKMPLKMLFPLVFFMFPALFVIILGPAVINIIKVFSGF